MPQQPFEIWREWIVKIAHDPETDYERVIKHLQTHVTQHIPNAYDDNQRWVQWMAGTYNLLAILSGMMNDHPQFELGIGRLFQKWRKSPTDHTPPPQGVVEICRSMPR